VAKYFYPFATRVGSDDRVCLNMGYEEEPPMAVPLEASDEHNRFPIQLYCRTATQVDLADKRVLEVSCGHGGGASYLVRTLHPASYTGLDFNRAGIEFCRRMHHVPGLDFVCGNAENLPFEDQTFDAVLNIEASSYYPRFPLFLAEVARVLSPGGHFLYADVRPRGLVAKWEEELGNSAMRLTSERVISEEIARGLEKAKSRLKEVDNRPFPASLLDIDKAVPKICRNLRSGVSSYRMYCFAND